MDIAGLFNQTVNGDLEGVSAQLDDSPFLVHVKNPDADAWNESTLMHTAAKHGRRDVVKLLIDRGAEVYSHPFCTYPPVVIASWNKQQPVVDYFLEEIPDKASGTNGLGVTMNLSARQG